jgi:hypothetical protein
MTTHLVISKLFPKKAGLDSLGRLSCHAGVRVFRAGKGHATNCGDISPDMPIRQGAAREKPLRGICTATVQPGRKAAR